MFEVNDLCKSYGKIKALKDVSFSLKEGVWGLVGENGAGKSTIMKLLTSQIRPDSGSVKYNDMQWNAKNRPQIGYLPQNFDFYGNFTLMEAMKYIYSVRGSISKSSFDDIRMWLDCFNLSAYETVRIKALSGGMKQRFGIAQAFLGDPELILLDEPTVGLDPKERLTFRNIINDLCENRTILISTHLLDDVESTCESFICLKNGIVTYEGSIKNYISDFKYDVFTARMSKSTLKKTDNMIELISLKREEEDYTVRFIVTDRDGFFAFAQNENISVCKAEINLEDAYYVNNYLNG